ncbi:MAG: PfkB family carbohydrate kinase [Puniceicoccales bacterium]|jgi:D-beta-D-heptose 7-phosphate kinase/D-beta-D-heptose 1-phosphate adenosyltransferase|nr:PfkB family carbohydrate kinase [Puniceicoccales bacterium]
MDKLLTNISRLKIFVLGDIMLDRYIFGDVFRISPEAPVPVVSVQSEKYMLGAAANVALNLKALGVDVEVCGIIGDDGYGDKLESILHSSGIKIDQDFCIRKSVSTILKTRVLVRHQQLCRLDVEQEKNFYAFTLEDVKDFIKVKVESNDAVLISDYAKGVISSELVQHVENVAHGAGIFVAMDPKPKNRIAYKNMDLMTPNKEESMKLAGMDEEAQIDDFDSEVVCKNIFKKFSPKNLVITLGADGMLLCHNGDVIDNIPTYASEVFDVSGAGDTSIACLTAALVAGSDLRKAAHFANTAAGIVVKKLGTTQPTVAEILNYHG